MKNSKNTEEVRSGQRFAFGANWSNFLSSLNEDRINEAERSLIEMIGPDGIKGKSFLDIGSGSGLFSLAARRLGASVHSFDYDPKSVACTSELKWRFFPDDDKWQVEEGSALDATYLKSLGHFDIVYSWGVLHHTGSMYEALELAGERVALDGKLFIALYNDQGRLSRMWSLIKRLYNKTPNFVKPLLLIPCLFFLWGPSFIKDMIQLQPFKTWLKYKKTRGMSPWIDIKDWVGGFPFEVSKPEQIFNFYVIRNFELEKLQTCAGGHGCNEYIFKLKGV